MNVTGSIAIAVVALTAGLHATSATAQTYPDRPVKLLIGFAAGSSADVAARIVGEGMSKSLGQSVIVESRPGASSNIAGDTVVKAEADGYTLFFGSIANVINKAVGLGSAIDLAKDLKPVALLCVVPNILVVNPSVKANTVAELIALAKADPGKLNYGSAGVGSTPHLSAELFNAMAGVKIVHVPYKGTAQAAQDLVGGTLQVMFAPSSTVLGLIEGKQLRALAWTIAKRSPALPDLPTAIESGLPGFETAIWFGINAPAALPDAIRDKLAGAAAASVASEAVVKAFRAQGIEPLTGGPADYGRYIVNETAKWTDVVAKAGLGK
jgi:tripartite-type tricarboxylate transporter receptor subunit TctC